jgi:integrase/recombinase XerD
MRKDNFVILTDKTYQPIEEYLSSRGKVNSSEPLFTSISNNSKGERLSTRSISYIAKEGLKAIGLDERAFTAHSLEAYYSRKYPKRRRLFRTGSNDFKT